MPDDAPLFMLPTPTEDEVAGFIGLYRTKYGIDLDPADAGRMLGGLVRFLYLTGTAPTAEAQPHVPAHPTQLTAGNSGRSRKKA